MAGLKNQLLDPLTTQIAALKTRVAELDTELALLQLPVDQAKSEEKTSERIKLKEAIQEVETQKEKIANAYTRSETLIKEFDEFNKNLTAASDGKSMSLFATVALRQYWEQQRITHVLYITTVSLGGESVTARRLFRSPTIGFLGGGVVTYILAKTSGEIIAADTITSLGYSKYQLAKDKAPVLQHT